MDKARIKSPDKLYLPVAGDKTKAVSKGSSSPTKIESPKATSGLAKKDLQEEMKLVEETGMDEASLQKRCQVLEGHLAKERLLKAQALDREKKKDARIAKLEEDTSKVNAKLEEEKRRAKVAAERERKAEHEHGRSDEHIARIKQAQEDARKEIDAMTKVLEEEKAAREKAERGLREARECAQGQDQKQSAEMRNLLAKVEALERGQAAAAQEVQEGLQGKRQAGASSEAVSQEVEIVRAELQKVFEGERQQWEEKMKKQREVSNSLIKKLRVDAEAQSGAAAQKRVEELEEERLRLVQENKKLRARAEEAAGMESTLTTYSTALDARVEKAEAKNRALAKEKEELLGKLSGQERERIELEQRLAEAAMEKEAAADIVRAGLQKEFESERQRWEEKTKKQKEVTSNLVKQLKADAERQVQSSVAAQKQVEELEQERVRLVQESKKLRASGEEAAVMESTLTTYSTALDARVEKAEAKNRALTKEKEELLGKLSGQERERIELEQRLAEAAMEKEVAAEIVRAGLQKEFESERQRWEEKMKKQKEVTSNLVKQLKADAERQVQSSVAAQKRVEELEQERVRLVQESKKLRASGEEAAVMESTLTTFSTALDARVEKAEAKNRALAKEKDESLDKVAKLQKDRIKLEQRLTEAAAEKEAALEQKEAALEKLSQVESVLAVSEGEVNRVRMESASVKEQVIEIEATSSLLAAEKASLSDALELARNGTEHAEAQVTELNDYAAKLLAEKEVLKSDKLVAVEQNEMLVKLEASLKAEKQQLESELTELRVASTGLAGEVEALKQERAIAVEQNVLLVKAKEDLEVEKQQLKAEVKDHALKHKTVMAQLQALKEEKQVVVEQGTRHAQMMEALKAEKAQLGAELEQLLERMQGAKPQGERESGSKKEAHATLRTVAAHVEELHEKLVDLEHRSELLARAEEEREAAVRASAHKEAEIGRLREQVLILEARAVEAEAKVLDLQEALQAAQAQLAQISGFSQEKDAEIRGLWERVKEAARSQEEHELLKQKVAEQMASMLEAESRGRESQAQARKAEEAAQAHDKEMAQMETALEKREADVQGLKEQLQAKDAELDILRQQLQAQKMGAEELQKRFEATRLELNERNAVITLEKERKASLEAETQQMKQGSENAAMQASAAEERESQLQKRIGVLECEREELSARLQLEADARVKELAAKLATAEAELANKLSESEAESALRLSEAEAAAAEKLAAAQKELTAVRADLHRAKQELVEQKERWEREKCEQAERQVAELQQGVRERARAVEQMEKDLEESGGAIQQLMEGITRRDVRIKDLERELSEVRECFANELQAREKELEAEKARSAEARERLQETIARKDAEVGELRKEIQEIQNTVARHREEDVTLSTAPKETVARAGVADEIRRRKEELKVLKEVVQANKASPSKMRASWGAGSKGRLSDPGQPAERDGENGALEGEAREEQVLVPKAAGLKGRMSFIGRKAERKWDEEREGPTQESFGVDDEKERELQERLREKEGALAAEVARREKVEKQFADASSLLGLRTAEASRLEQARKEIEGHVAALEGQVGALQQELANESARVSELMVKVNDREDELARLKGANSQFSRGLVGARTENGHSNGGVEAEKGEALPTGRETGTGGAALELKQRVWDEDSVAAPLSNGKALENGENGPEERLVREVEELRGQLEREKARAEAASKEVQGRLAARERELGERLQELRNLEQQLEDEEGDKRRILTQMDLQRTQIDHLQQQLYGKKKSMEKLLTKLSDNEKSLEQLRISPGHSPQGSYGTDSPQGERMPSPRGSFGTEKSPGERKLSPTTSVSDLGKLRTEVESGQVDLSQRFEQAGRGGKAAEEEVSKQTAELEAIRKERAELREEVRTLREEVEGRESMVEALEEELDQLKVRLEDSPSAAGDSDRVRTLELDVRRLREELGTSKEREKALLASVDESKVRVAEKEKLLVEGDSKFEELRSRIASGEVLIRTLQDQVDALHSKLADKEDYGERLEREIGGQAAMLIKMQGDISEKERQLAEWEGLAEVHEAEVESLRKELGALGMVGKTAPIAVDDTSLSHAANQKLPPGTPRINVGALGTRSEQAEKVRLAEQSREQASPSEAAKDEAARGSLQEQLEVAVGMQQQLGQELSAERREWEVRLVKMKRDSERLQRQVAEERKLKNQALKGLQGKLRRAHFELGEIHKERGALLERVQGLAHAMEEAQERVLAVVEERLREQGDGGGLRSPKWGWLEERTGKSDLPGLDFWAIGSAASQVVQEKRIDSVSRSMQGASSGDKASTASVQSRTTGGRKAVAGAGEEVVLPGSEEAAQVSHSRGRADVKSVARDGVQRRDLSPSGVNTRSKRTAAGGSGQVKKRSPQSRKSPSAPRDSISIREQEKGMVEQEERDESRIALVVACTVGVMALLVVMAGRLGLL